MPSPTHKAFLKTDKLRTCKLKMEVRCEQHISLTQTTKHISLNTTLFNTKLHETFMYSNVCAALICDKTHFKAPAFTSPLRCNHR